MTKKIGDTVIIEAEDDRRCALCGEMRECRLYGSEGKDICFACAMKPENIDIVKDTFKILIGTPQTKEIKR